MASISEQRLWVVVHLLYPNSSQALDVYYTLLSLVTKKNTKDYSLKLFKKLVQLYLKTPAVRSSQPYQVFENEKLNNWINICKRSSKQQLLVICGIVGFKFSVEEIADALNMPQAKIRFLINQTFKKTSQISIVKPSIKSEFAYKKKSENQISYIYTNENLVEYGLGLLSNQEKDKVEQGLAIYKQLVPLQSFYKEVIDEIQNLVLTENNAYLIQVQEDKDQKALQPETISFDFLRIRKKFLVLTTVSALFIAVVSIRPAWLQNISFKSSANSIVVQEIKSQPYIDEKDSVALNTTEQAINLNEMPVAKNLPKPTDPIQAAVPVVEKPAVVANTQKPDVAKAEIKPEVKPIEKNTVAKVDEKPAKIQQQVAAKKENGLYRASISVTDLNVVSARITEKLVALGGKKAGEVELGWKKSPTLSYYHLTIPEENLEAVKNFLKNYGKLNIQFENHPRLLPAGVNRIILEVKESE